MITAIAALGACVPTVGAADAPAKNAIRPALTVNLTQPQRTTVPLTVRANGSIAAWQEASIGTEAQGLRLATVQVNVGDVVKRGQVLATFAPDTVQADAAQIRAAVAEAEATAAEATANAERARTLQATGALSAQQINQYLTAERTALARLDAQRAASRTQQLRLKQTQVLAPDFGVISARSATVGAVLPAGQELFRMIRQGRLEWRAEVPSVELSKLAPGMPVQITLSSDGAAAHTVAGSLRIVAPTVDAQTRNGLVYVDLAAGSVARAGMFARGEFLLGSSSALTLPQSAVVLRDGFSYALRVGADSKVREVKLGVGRRVGERIEITSGLDAAAQVVLSGGGFLTDGDTVRVVATSPATPPAATLAAPSAAAAGSTVK
jgi:HlyD family secretion protein